MSEDTRFIVSPDTNQMVALIAVHPMTSTQTLAGMFVISRNSLTYYDFHGMDFISGNRAEDLAEQGLATTTGTYFATMALPYSMGAAGAAWLVPIYWTSAVRDSSGNLNITPQDTLTLAGARLINALDVSKTATVFVSEGYTGAALVRELKNRYQTVCCGVTPTSSNQTQVTVTIKDISSYIKDGQTHLVIKTDNSTYPYIEATPTTISIDKWQALLFLKPGDKLVATIQQVGNIWTIVDIPLS
jgi:hypothetical protein